MFWCLTQSEIILNIFLNHKICNTVAVTGEECLLCRGFVEFFIICKLHTTNTQQCFLNRLCLIKIHFCPFSCLAKIDSSMLLNKMQVLAKESQLIIKQTNLVSKTAKEGHVDSAAWLVFCNICNCLPDYDANASTTEGCQSAYETTYYRRAKKGPSNCL